MPTAVKQLDPLEILRAPFPPEVIKWRPGAKSGNRAMALGYVDARDVMERFDSAFTPWGWTDNYSVLGGAVEANIMVQNGDRYITKTDVGYSNDPGTDKETEPLKAAYSDAFKRAAVKWGVGRDLYELPDLWLDLDSSGKRFLNPPVFHNGKWQTTPPDQPSRGGPSVVVPDQVVAADVDASTLPITDAQRKKLLAKATDLNLSEAQVKAAWALLFQKKSSKDLTVYEFNQALIRLDDPKFVETLREVQAIS